MHTLWLPLLLSSVIWAEEQYFPQSYNATWDEGRLHCQSCFKELTTITSRNVHLIVQDPSFDCWVGLRKSYNGSFPWAAWSNGDPVRYQNWYPGHPVPNKEKKLIPICSSTPQSPLSTLITTQKSTPMTSTQTSTITSASLSSVSASVFQTNKENDTCPILYKLLFCLNMSCDDLESSMTICNRTPTATPETTTYSTTPEVTTLSTTFNAATNGTTTESSTTSNCVFEPEPDAEEYIEDACVVLLSFGMWKEEDCNRKLPFICYEERFFGQINISSVTTSTGNVSWSEGPGAKNISHYRVEVTGDKNQTFNQKNLFQYIETLTAGTLYKVQVFPVKCDRDLNPQNISFYTLPSDVQNLIVVSVTDVSANLNWSKPDGNHDFYSVAFINASKGEEHKCDNEECTITDLIPGTEYEFTVKAVVNKTIEGVPSKVSDYTKPSTVRKLRSADNDSTVIMAFWDPPTGSHSGYRYCLKEVNNSLECTYCNITSDISNTANNNITNSSDTTTVSITDCKTVDGTETSIKESNKSDGSMFCLCVAALTKSNNLSGEMVTILAYTRPKSVDLTLIPSLKDMKATWEIDGNYEKFEVTITSADAKDIHSYNTTDKFYTFRNLKAGVFYTVSVVTLNGDLRSAAVNKSDYTRPAKPTWVKASANKNNIQLSWGAPSESGGALIQYIVKYNTSFWDETNETATTETNITISNLRPGTKYMFNVMVLAGNLSDPATTTTNTEPEKRTLVLTMLCSSQTTLHCDETITRNELFEKLKKKFDDKFQDLVYWKLKAKASKDIL
ncbi:receptor-type tyrosine-protein phosphatase eta-like isoform X1 [Carassius carassius]|uniref:receptor-type tyrosine-protein phosphatase eta-like isoform X1 n=1 Tax=Carassius carassius TaxID=217509 RepID=UPI0028693DB9|nr:receptor-type tyrosine-protein phosphatase eta-like isoform X1 [Carassius carassius]